MAILAVFILLSVAQAVFGSPIGLDAFYDLKNALSFIVVSRFLTIVLYPVHFLAMAGPDGTQNHSNCESPLN